MPQPNANFPSALAGEARALRSLARCLARGDDADDLTQDVFVTALAQPTRPRSLRPWLRQVLRNEVRANARRDHRRRKREQTSWVPDPPSSPDDTAARAELVDAVQEALRRLDEPYRGVLHARFYADRTAVDIARSEGCNAGTVRWRLQEGLRRMRRTLDERFDGREQWLGGVVALAGIPMPSTPANTTGPTQGANTMTKMTLLKVLAGAAVVTGGSALALSSDAPVAEKATVAAAPEAPMQAASTAQPQEVRSGGDSARVLDAIEARASAKQLDADEEDPPTPPCANGECADTQWAADADAPDPEATAKALGAVPRGADDPLVTIVECTDYECPFCKEAREKVDRIIADYGDKVAVYELLNPLPFHKKALPASKAALAAGQQGKFWEMADFIFDHPDKREDGDYEAYAVELGLDVEQFRSDYAGDDIADAVEKHKRACLGNGARGTPSFFINGDLLVGNHPYERFKEMIEDELAQAEK